MGTVDVLMLLFFDDDPVFFLHVLVSVHVHHHQISAKNSDVPCTPSDVLIRVKHSSTHPDDDRQLALDIA